MKHESDETQVTDLQAEQAQPVLALAPQPASNAEVNLDDLKELTGDEILSADDIVIECVAVPEWGGKVYVRTMSALDRERYVESVREITRRGKKTDVKFIMEQSGAKLLVRTICTKEGKLLFENKQSVLDKLSAKSAMATERVKDVASRINGLDETGEEDAKNGSSETKATSSASSSD